MSRGLRAANARPRTAASLRSAASAAARRGSAGWFSDGCWDRLCPAGFDRDLRGALPADGGGCERAPEPAVGWDALRRASGDNLTGRGVSMSGLEHSAPICLDERSCCSFAHSWSYEASEEEGMTVAVKVCAECY